MKNLSFSIVICTFFAFTQANSLLIDARRDYVEHCKLGKGTILPAIGLWIKSSIKNDKVLTDRQTWEDINSFAEKLLSLYSVKMNENNSYPFVNPEKAVAVTALIESTIDEQLRILSQFPVKDFENSMHEYRLDLHTFDIIS